MRLLLVLLVLLYASFVYASDLTCKQLCADKKTCCSAPLDNEYYFKSIECVGEKASSCSNKMYIAESEYFAKGSTITICKLNKDDLVVQDRLGKHSSDGRYSDVSSAVSSITNSVSSSLSSLASSAAGSSSGDFDNSYTGDDSGAALKKKNHYKGGDGKFVEKKLLQLHDDELQGKKKPHTSHAAVLAIQAVANSVQSAMASTIDTTGVFGEGLYTPSEEYKGGDGELTSTNKIIIGKCVKVSNVNNNFSTNKHLDKPIIGGSKQICKDLFGSESCESEQHKTISVVQSTKNDGFSNNGVFDITHSDYEIIIKHGNILRNQCELKGKCQFNRA